VHSTTEVLDMGRSAVARKQDPAFEQRSRIVEAIRNYDLSKHAAWRQLRSLSTKAMLEGIEADPEGVLVDANGHFRGVMNVYVTLEYGTGASKFADSESLLGRFEGHLEPNGGAKIDDISVDTTPLK